MNSLQELNNHGETQVEFDDDRDADVIFDLPAAVNQTYSGFEGVSHEALVGIEIIEIINYQTSAPSYKLDVTDLSGATVEWTYVPSSCTVTNPSTGIYIISGFRNPAEWDDIKNPTIHTPNNFQGEWVYESTITWNGTETHTWTVTETLVDYASLTTPTQLNYVSGVDTSNGSYTTRIQDPGTISGIVWTITCTPSRTASINTMSAPGTGGIGGTSSFNSTTKVLTITGTEVQVNNRLTTMIVNIVDGEEVDFTITYVSTNNTNSESDTVTQNCVSTRIDYLGLTRSSDTYQLNTATTITGGPLITDLSNSSGLGTYQLEITAVPTSSVSTMSVDAVTQVIDVFAPSTDENFGRTLVISGDGNTLAVQGTLPGATDRYQTDRGYVDIYVKSNGSWTRQARVRSTQTSLEGTFATFGNNIFLSTDGNTMLISDSFNQISGSESGAVFTFTRSGSTWTQIAVVSTPNSPGLGDAFGRGLSTDSNISIMAVGANLDETVNTNEGIVTIWTRDGSTWTQTQTLKAPTPVASGRYGNFVSVSPDGNWLGVSDNPDSDYERVYIYQRSGNTYSYVQTITFSGQTITDTVGGISFSNTNRLAISYGVNTTKYVKMYNSGGGSFALTQTITVTGTSAGAPSVRLSLDDRVLYIGDYSYNSYTGRVMAYRRGTTNWSNLGTIGNGAAANDNYGYSISTPDSADVLVSSAYGFDGAQAEDGRVYVITNALSGLASFGAGTLVIFGTRDQVNHMIDGFNLTPATGYSSNFQLYYRLVTPTSNVARRNQYINKV